MTTPLKGLERGTTDKPGTDERKQSEWTFINYVSTEGKGVTLTKDRRLRGFDTDNREVVQI